MKWIGSRLIYLFLVAVIGLLCAGCVQETRNGDGAKYTYQLWVPLSITAAGIGGTVIGGVLWTFQNRYKWTLLVIGVIAVVMGPSTFLDYATVDAQGLSIRTGLPYLAATERVQFDDVQQVRETEKISRGRRGRKTRTSYYEFDLKSGETIAVSVSGNVLRQQARHRINEQLQARGIQVVRDF
jgi:hypothetical protein